MANRAFLEREDVLKYIDTIDFKTQYIKITILDNTNTPLRAIEGRATGGNININGSSAVRRTGTLTLVTEYIEHPEDQFDVMNAVSDIETLISMNKRVKIELGIENNGPQYREHPMFWFTLGSYMIQNASVTYNIQQGIQISLKLMDKMALLNGEMGGTFTESVTHSPAGVVKSGVSDLENMKECGVPIRDLLEYFLRDCGELTTAEFRIEDLPTQIRNQMRWVKRDKRLIINPTDASGKYLTLADLNSTEGFGYNQSFGYIMTDFVYPLEGGKTLETKAGETITSVLDKIKNTLGNYEYFFDVDGVFHFREIKNGLNEGSTFDDLTTAIADRYFFETLQDQSVYSFKDARLVSSYSNNPQYNQIKNDFVVWGKDGNEQDLRYHLRLQEIPDAPELSKWIVGFTYEPDELGHYRWVITTAAPGAITSSSSFITSLGCNGDKEPNQYNFQIDFSAGARPGAPGRSKDDDWRLLMYLEAIQKSQTRRTPFDKELIASLPTLYQLEFEVTSDGDLDIGQVVVTEFFKPTYDRYNLHYWVDVINTNDAKLMQTADVKQFGIETIGKRTKVFNEDKVNCLFSSASTEIEKYDFIETNEVDVRVEGDEIQGWKIYVPKDFVFPETQISFWLDCVGLGTIENPAFDFLRSSLHEYLSYNNNINIQVLPVYHLDVNQRITVENKESDIYGDYVINTISLPLALNGMMTINARKAVERI